MNHSVVYPLAGHPSNRSLFAGDAVATFALAAERAGFGGISFTDHPAPSQKWLDAGGHDALDPFAALSFVAGVTTELRLIPHVVVLPYRNPFVVAKAAATLDALSGGRFVLSVAVGYLRSEYSALGVDFDRRNELFDEALEVLRGVWREDDFHHDGANFPARGVTTEPKPANVPIWIGGNSALTRRRVARTGDGWNPFRAGAGLARTARTPPLETLDELAPLIAELRQMTEEAGRDPGALDIQFGTGLPEPGTTGFSASAEVDLLADLAALGVTWNSVNVPGESLAVALEAIEQYGTEVIAQQR